MRAWNVFISFYYFFSCVDLDLDLGPPTYFLSYLICSCFFLDMFIYSYDCVCESLSMLLATRSRSENRYGSGVFVLSTSFHLFLFCHGVKGGCDGGKNRQPARKGGNGFDLFALHDFPSAYAIAWSPGPSTFTFGSNRKYEEKNQFNHFAQQLPGAHGIRMIYPEPPTAFISFTHFFSFSGQFNIFQVMAMIPDPALHGFPFASRCSYQRCSCFCASRSACAILLVRELVIATGHCGFRACLFPGCHAVLIISWFSFLPLATGCTINAL